MHAIGKPNRTTGTKSSRRCADTGPSGVRCGFGRCSRRARGCQLEHSNRKTVYRAHPTRTRNSFSKSDSDLGLLRPVVLPQPRSSFCGSVAGQAGVRLTSRRGGYGCRHGPITDVLTTLSPRALATCGAAGVVLLPALVPLVAGGGFWRACSRHRLDRAWTHHCDGQATLGAGFVGARAAARRQSGPQGLPIQSHVWSALWLFVGRDLALVSCLGGLGMGLRFIRGRGAGRRLLVHTSRANPFGYLPGEEDAQKPPRRAGRARAETRCTGHRGRQGPGGLVQSARRRASPSTAPMWSRASRCELACNTRTQHMAIRE